MRTMRVDVHQWGRVSELMESKAVIIEAGGLVDQTTWFMIDINSKRLFIGK